MYIRQRQLWCIMTARENVCIFSVKVKINVLHVRKDRNDW
ncbi:hypothetical protein SNOG_03705 [Parastagonospora nodorum SN15]|uniref:Uncharacterized protein n=1 Tax=Phaeosphaeria nodorum (strain SN15 / ATCC MYA-4574 / FGSC 10173) TaxID=321614 RepID=Q0UX09_PHANO|nr:hypothetical protein SNOG_03705 [Parastagonospora nodorum SN15]EAT88910.1 hypothetical protein SNOG_03705 [Parastagonospora nodorum SN15]